MGSRLLAAGLLVASALLAWLTVTITLAARLLQLGVALSLLYVGYLAWHGWRTMRHALRYDGPTPGRMPFVSAVVPARDEASVIGGVAADLALQSYTTAGTPDYEVVVVDDGSIDATADRARAVGGEHLRVVRREPATGPPTKAAAINFALPQLRGEIIAVIDADARVAPDFLERVMSAWQRDPTAAAIQAQRRPTNADHSALTRAQLDEQLMDMASQCGRWATDGTAELRGNGMFVRREILEQVGGWNATAITEDLDLSTRLSSLGLHVTLAPEATVGEEAVETLADLWRQRMRWAEGSLRRLLEHGPRLVAGSQPIGRKLDFLAFAGEFLLPPLFVTTIGASLLTIPLPRPADWTVPLSLFLGYGLSAFLLAIAGLAADGRRGLALIGGSLRGALFLSHWLLVVPAALVRIAVRPATTTFVKTPRSIRLSDR